MARSALLDSGMRRNDGAWLAGVHPSFELHAARPPGFEPRVAGLALRPDGTLLVSTWDRDGAVYALDESNGTLLRLTAARR